MRRIPSGTTPVPDGASLPRITRPSAPPSRARPIAWSAARRLPQWTISIAMPDATSASMSASGSAVVPPLMWPTMCGRASRTTSARIADEPAIDGPPVWNVETNPCARAQASIGAASAPVFTEPSPTSPMRLTPASASSAKSCSSRPSSRIGAPARTFTPAGPQVRVRPLRDDRERLEPDDVLGPPGEMDLARRDRRRDAAVEARLDEVARPLARRPVAEHRVDVAVDETRERRRAVRVDDDVRVLVEAAPDRDEPAVLDEQRVGVRERRRDVAGDDLGRGR